MSSIRDKSHISGPLEIGLLVFLLFLALAARIYLLEADSPDKIVDIDDPEAVADERLSFSQGLHTDPPAYTLYARNEVVMDTWNPYEDRRFPSHQFSLISVVAIMVFQLAGVGMATTNLTAVVLAMVSLILFYLYMRKATGPGLALLALLFCTIGFISIFYGRRPFLENGMNSILLLGLVVMAYGRRNLLAHFAFGLCLMASILYGKLIGVGFFAIPLACYGVWWQWLHDKRAVKYVGAFVIGCALTAILWYVTVYSPHAAALGAYIGEQSVSGHGRLQAFVSIDRFIWRVVSFGIQSNFFLRQPVISLGAAAGLVLIAGVLFNRRKKAVRRKDVNVLIIILGAWLAGTYVFQMIWNYQPVRYQTTMIFPLAGLTAFSLHWLYIKKDAIRISNRSLWFAGNLFLVLLITVYQATAALFTWAGVDFYFTMYFPFVLALVLLIVIGHHMLSRRYKDMALRIPGIVRTVIVALMVIISIGVQIRYFAAWAQVPLFTTRDASRDLGLILSPGAVLTGPYAPALTVENKLGAITHTFGYGTADRGFLHRFPITHLALDRSNTDIVSNLYPELMARAEPVAQYYISCRKVSIFRIAGLTENTVADRYFQSSFERAEWFYRRGIVDSARIYLDRFQQIYPENYSGNFLRGVAALSQDEFRPAADALQRATVFSPTDFNLHYLLYRAYIGLSEAEGDAAWREKAKFHLELARRLNLGYYDFDDKVDKGQHGEERGESSNDN